MMKAPPASLSSCDQAFQICRPLLRSPAKSPTFVAICRPFQISSCDQASLFSCDRDEDHPIHFVGHSAGAQVVRVLQQMLADKVWFVILIINSRKSGLAYAFYNKQKYKTKT